MERCAPIRPPFPGEDVHPGHGGNGSQGLAPEAKGANGGQILRPAELAGGMAQKGRGKLRWRDAAAVIGDAQIGETPVLYLHRNGGGPGVQGVFQQLLGHAGRALHHLAGGNEVGYVRV